MPNLVKVLQDRTVHMTIMSNKGNVLNELDIKAGNGKGIFVFTVGNGNVTPTDRMFAETAEALIKTFPSMLDAGMIVLPYGVKLEYIKVD